MAAEEQQLQERTEPATPKRREEAKKKGQVARSRDLTSAVLVFGGTLLLFWLGSKMMVQLKTVMAQSLAVSRQDLFDGMAPGRFLGAAFADFLWMIFPFLTLALVLAILGSVLLGGLVFSEETFALKGERLNPISGLKRVFSLRGLFELGKSLLKTFIVFGVSVLVLWLHRDDFWAMGVGNLGDAIASMASFLQVGFVWIAASLILIAALDVPYQIWEQERKLKMTIQEVREELKETEGSPEMRQRIRQLQRDLARRRMMLEVPKAQVVVTNPEHYAVALRYDSESMKAPKVVAKGVDMVALNIKTVAKAHTVPVIEAPMLARALYKHCKLEAEIPALLYIAVAQVLAYVYRLNQKGQVEPFVLDESTIPVELVQ